MMDTRHLVDPELAPVLDQFPTLQFTPEILPQVRAMTAEMNAGRRALLPTFPDIELHERQVPGPAGAPDVPVRIYRPRGAAGALPGLLWIHGGGYILRRARPDAVPGQKGGAARGRAA